MEPRSLWRGRPRTLLLAFVLLLGLLPLGAVTADNQRTASRTEISFDASLLGAMMDADGWIDAAGILRVRDQAAQGAVTGDIEGNAEVTFNADIVPGAGCDLNDLLSCSGGWLTGWGSAVITNETGTWEGDFIIEAELTGGLPDISGKLIMAGRGGNAGTSIVTDISLGETGDSASFEGFLLTMAQPAFGINLQSQVCFDEAFVGYGAFIASGAIESSGAARATFDASDGPWTYRYGVAGEATFTDENGSLDIEFTAMAQDSATTKVDWGHWVITGGTGAYEHAYGHGKVTGYVGDFAQCSLGQGVWLQYLGDVHFN